MNNFTETQKQNLQTLVEGGTQVVTVAYDPTSVVDDPEADALGAGYSVYYREDTTNLVEVIYTK